MVCASPHDSPFTTACSGDSGSSLICMQDSKPVFAGVLNSGVDKQCGTPNSIEIYTKSEPYLEWIKQNMV